MVRGSQAKKIQMTDQPKQGQAAAWALSACAGHIVRCRCAQVCLCVFAFFINTLSLQRGYLLQNKAWTLIFSVQLYNQSETLLGRTFFCR